MKQKSLGASRSRAAGAATDVRPAIATVSLRDRAYEAIKHRIMTCAFRPGEYVNELRLSATLKLGRTPVHQALARLMVEGLVDIIPRKGVVVKPVSLNELLQIIEARLANETYSARLAAEHADERDIAGLDDVLDRTRAWASKRNVEHMMLLDREFHLLLTRAAKNHVLTEVLRGLHERSLRFWFISLSAPAQHECVCTEHQAIVEAIRQREPLAADRAMRAHIESFRANVTRFL